MMRKLFNTFAIIKGILSFLFLLVFAFSISAENILSEKFKSFLDVTHYIMLSQEREVFLKLTSDRDRDIFIESFWKQRDPTSETPENEYREDHLKRFNYANRHFGRGTTREGWMTDMGKIHILLGSPASLERVETTIGIYPVQIWYYYGDREKGLPSHFAIVFFQRYGAGEFRIYDPLTDGPGSLLIQAGPSPHSDYRELYETLRELSPSLAEVSLSLIPGQIPMNYQPSPINAIILADILDSPKKQVNSVYATHFLKLKGFVTTEYMTNFIESDFFFDQIRDPVTGIDFLHFSIAPKNLTFQYYEPQDQFYCNIQIDVSLRTDENHILYQYTKNFPLYFNAKEYQRIQSSGISIEDFFPIIEGKYSLTVLLRNTVSKQFNIAERHIVIPPHNESPFIHGPFFGYNFETYHDSHYMPFRILRNKIFIDPKNTFAASENIALLFHIGNAGNPLPEMSFIQISIRSLSENGTFERTLTYPIADILDKEDAQIIRMSQFLPTEKLPPDYYEVALALIDDTGEVLENKTASFAVTYSDSIPHPQVHLKAIPSSEIYVFYYMLAHQYENMKSYRDAEILYDYAATLKTDYSIGLIQYANFLFRVGKFKEMLVLTEYFKDDENNRFNYFLLTGKAYLGLENYSEAVKFLLSGNEIYDSDTSLLNSLGICYHRLGDDHSALSVLQASLKLNPSQPEVSKLIENIKKSFINQTISFGPPLWPNPVRG